MALISCNDVAFGYDGETVLSGINFSLKGGEYLCIVGENGAGKSTLIKGLLRLKSPSSGTVEMSEGLKASEIGYLPQQTLVQKNFPASVLEVVMSGRINSMGLRPFYSKEDRKDALEKISMMGMEGFEKRCYQDLSGGQQQRVLLARALCATKKMILLDEPVAGLDPVATADLYELIKEINEKMNITVIMVSHDTHAAMKYASHILHLSNEQLFFGTSKEFANSSEGQKFLGICKETVERGCCHG